MAHQMAVLGNVCPTGQFYKYIPDDPAKFLAYRRELLASVRADADGEVAQEAIWRICRDDFTFFVKAFLEPALRERESGATQPLEVGSLEG